MTTGHSLHKLQLVLYAHRQEKKKKKKSTDPSTEGVSRAFTILSCSPNILCFRTRVSEEVPESLRLDLAQEMQMCDATTNVVGDKCIHL